MHVDRHALMPNSWQLSCLLPQPPACMQLIMGSCQRSTGMSLLSMQQETPACLQLALGPCQKALARLQQRMPKETLAWMQVIMRGQGRAGMCHTARRPPRVAPTAEEVPTPTRPLEFSAEARRCSCRPDKTQDRFATTMSLDRFTTTMSIMPAGRPSAPTCDTCVAVGGP